MKPRTKLQIRVFDLSKNYIPSISESEKLWAYKECLEHKAYANKTSVFCLDCGETFTKHTIKRKRAVCPNCNTKLKVEDTRNRTDKQRVFFSTAAVVQEFQVIRNFELIAYYKKGKPVKYFLHEILQSWVGPNDKTTMVGKLHTTSGWSDSWSGDWAIRVEKGWYNKYIIDPYKYHPKAEFKQEYSKYWKGHNIDQLNFTELSKRIPDNPKLETLLKCNQKQLLFRGFSNSGEINMRWPSIKICIRNKYKVKDASMWMDYLDLLQYFNKDLRNSKYVCPKSLKMAHDKLVNKKRVIQQKQKLERKRKQVKEAQEKYVKQKQMFFGLKFKANNITVQVIDNVQKFMEEGDALKHCLFTNEYYNKKDSLILSAKKEGTPIETVEISLSKMKILQSRGLGNKASKHNTEIVSLVNNNMHKINSIIKQFSLKEAV